MNILKFNFKVDIMEVKNFKTHWDNAYKNSNIEDLGWYERTPKATLGLFEKYNVSKDSLLYKCNWSPFEGQTFDCSIFMTFVNGQIVYNQGKIVSDPKGNQLIFDR